MKIGKWVKKHLVTIIIFAVLLIGLGLLLYPSIANYWNSFHQSRAIMSYSEEVAGIDKEEYEKLIADAQDYNRRLAKNGMNWKMSESELAEYNALLDFTKTGIMGYITIDRIDVSLPVYHGTSESVLQKSIGHIDGTSLPVGTASYDPKTSKTTDETEGVHCVVSGHRGLPSSRLFSDLDKLVEGDIFTLNVLDNTYTYQVDQIRIVEPHDMTDLTIEQGKDYCTLVTCTPYGINTHRLLVRGHRVANIQGDLKVVSDAFQIKAIYIAPFIAVPILLILLTFLLITTRKRRRYS